MTAFQPELPDRQSPDRIRSRPCPACYLCGAPGLPLYEGVRDRLFGAPGTWNFRRCPTLNCGLMWLDPIPVEEEIGKAYAEYYTHAETPTRHSRRGRKLRRVASALISLANPVRGERDRLSLMHLDKVKPGKLLDVGCGNGVRLARLRSLGWDVYGQDVDPAAVAYARKTFGLEVQLDRLQDIGDPLKLLGECRHLLRAGGQLVIVTPNSECFAHKHFGLSWRGLEPPRHIHVFSPKTLSAAATIAGLTVCRSWTTVANTTTFWRGSMMIRNGEKDISNWVRGPLTRVRALGYLYRSIFEHLRDTNSGEECVLVATH